MKPAKVDACHQSVTQQERLAALRDRAKALFAMGRLHDSLAAHDEALRLAPDAVIIRLSAGRIAHALELQEQSLRHFEAAAQADCIAADATNYVDIAVRIGTDPAHAGALRERILARKHVLFEDPRVVQEFERFFLEVSDARYGPRVR